MIKISLLILAALLLAQSKPFPSDADFKKAQSTLAANPEDQDSSTLVGKYLAFVQGDFDAGLKYLAKSGEKPLKNLAEHENTPDYTDTPPKRVGMGDEWVAAAKASPALFRPFFDRASYWYAKAWPDLDALWKNKLREQATRLAAARPPGGSRKGLPSAWKTDMGSPALDCTVARSGSYSVKLAGDPKTETFLKSELIPLTGKTIEYSAWVRSEATDSPNDQVGLNYFDKNGRFIGGAGVGVPVDLPFWIKVSGKTDTYPADTASIKIIVALRSGHGALWVDDMVLKIDGKDALKNGSFEDK